MSGSRLMAGGWLVHVRVACRRGRARACEFGGGLWRKPPHAHRVSTVADAVVSHHCTAADCTVCIWDPHTGKYQRTLEGHTQGVSDVAWSSDSTYVATASDDTTVKIWHVATVRLAHRRVPPRTQRMTCAPRLVVCTRPG